MLASTVSRRILHLGAAEVTELLQQLTLSNRTGVRHRLNLTSQIKSVCNLSQLSDRNVCLL